MGTKEDDEVEERNFSANTVLAGALWVVGGALILADLCFVSYTWNDLSDIGLYLSGIGGVLTIRGYHREQRRLARNAFEMGRDFERGEQSQMRLLR